MFGERTEPVRDRQEQAIIELVAQGFTNRDIAKQLGTTEYIVKNNLRTIYDKLGLWNRVELALWYEARKHENRRSSEVASLAGIRDSTTIPTPEVN